MMTVTNCFHCYLSTATPAMFSQPEDTFYVVKEYDASIATPAMFSQPEDTFYMVKEYDASIAAMMTNKRRHRGIPDELQSLSMTELQENLVDAVFDKFKYKNAFKLSEMVIKFLHPTSPIEIDNSESRMQEEAQNLMALHFSARKRKAHVLTDQRSEGYSPPVSDADVHAYSYKKAQRTTIQGTTSHPESTNTMCCPQRSKEEVEK
jgi:hypothetical protein